MKIILADDHTLFREAMLHPLQQLDPNAEVLQAGTATQALELAAANPNLDLVLLDLSMPGAEGLSAVMAFRDRFPDAPLVVLSANEDHDNIEKVLDAGASGFIPKSSSTQVMLGALRLVLSGGVYLPELLLSRTQSAARPAGAPPAKPGARGTAGALVGVDELTPRQLEVLQALAEGLSNKQIGRKLNLSEGTVKVHLAAIFRALDAKNRTDAVIRAEAKLRENSRG
jgi:DNA-binding NarL/FixJ family response regulator